MHKLEQWVTRKMDYSTICNNVCMFYVLLLQLSDIMYGNSYVSLLSLFLIGLVFLHDLVRWLSALYEESHLSRIQTVHDNYAPTGGYLTVFSFYYRFYLIRNSGITWLINSNKSFASYMAWLWSLCWIYICKQGCLHLKLRILNTWFFARELLHTDGHYTNL